MQETLKKAALWYIRESGFELPQMQQDLAAILRHRKNAFDMGDLEKVYKVFAFTEIVKAAICLTKDLEYNTVFSKLELKIIKKYSNPKPDTFICRKCGCEYPASAFAEDTRYTNNLSRYCIACTKEISAQKRAAAIYKQSAGYINHRGEIICHC